MLGTEQQGQKSRRLGTPSAVECLKNRSRTRTGGRESYNERRLRFMRDQTSETESSALRLRKEQHGDGGEASEGKGGTGCAGDLCLGAV